MTTDDASPQPSLGGQIVWRPNPGPQTTFLRLAADEALFGGEMGGGKLLRLTERITTPTGWTTMGEVRVGDLVVDADGIPVRVTALSAVETDAEAWELEFDDGERVIACADHQWLTLTCKERAAQSRMTDAARAARRAERPKLGRGAKPWLAERNAARAGGLKEPPPSRGRVRTTAEIAASLRGQNGGAWNHAIQNPAPAVLPEAELPIDPYVLGAWLGDGSSRGGVIYGIDPEVWENVEAAGYVVKHYRVATAHGVRGLTAELRAIGQIKPRGCARGTPSHKHIPQAYLRGSIAQRLALLQGLCDTDGHATDRGGIEFTTTSRALRDGMVELLATLGIKPSVRLGRAMLNGRDISAKWRIGFYTALPCFRIARKAARQKREGFRGVHDRRYVVGARRVPSEPMRCISVDSPTRTYLIGDRMIPTHNSVGLLAGATRHIHHPSYRGVIFRRYRDSLFEAGGLVERATVLYRRLGARSTSQGRVWLWPSGARVDLDSLANPNVLASQRGEYQYVGFDELSEWDLAIYWETMLTRLRSSAGIPVRARATANPGGKGEAWIRERFAPWIYPPGHPEYDGPRAADGQTLWFRLDDATDRIVRCERGEPGAMSRSFVAARTATNVHLDRAKYHANLSTMDALTRRRMRDGDFLAKVEAGEMFRREWWSELTPDGHGRGTIVATWPGRVVGRVRYWDFAATEKVEGKKPAATAGVRQSLDHEGFTTVEDVTQDWLRPGQVEELVLACAQRDRELFGFNCPTVIELDPGQAGVSQAARYAKILAGLPFRTVRPSGDKVARARPFSSQAEAGRVRLVRNATWNGRLIDELVAFPLGKLKDQVDACSGGYLQLLTRTPLIVPGSLPQGARRETARHPGGY